MKVIALVCWFAVVVNAIPKDWQAQIDNLNAFFAEDDTAPLNNEGYPRDMYLPLLGNGYLSQEKGVRGDTMFVSGLFNNETTSPSHRARIPSLFAVTIDNTDTIGVLFDIEKARYTRRGQLSYSDNSSWYELQWYAHQTERSLYVMELTVHKTSELESVDIILSNNAGKPSEDINFVDKSSNNGVRLICGSTTIAETPESGTHDVCVASTVIPDAISITNENNHKTQVFIAAIRTTLDSTDVQTDTMTDYKNGMKLAAEHTLFSTHEAGWAKLWENGIQVQGTRTDVGIAVNASIYYVLSSVRADWPHGLAPGGLTNSYNGHSFWDTETWMYPPLLYLYPEISRSLVLYRYNRLDGAKLKAKSYDPPYAGTMFPWESAFSGVETCPLFADTGIREQHINGDISFAIWQEYLMRKDVAWLRDIGYPIMIGIADFWVSRVNITADGVAHILDVIPPDEYVDHVDDSVYTNYVAKLALEYAVKATEVLGVACASCNTYQSIADKLVIIFDEALQIHPEYVGYKGQVVKQADVVLLSYPLGLPMTSEVRRNDLDYYVNRTDKNGPAMTWGMHSINYLDLEDYTNAGNLFDLAYADNMHAPFHVWTETPSGNACNFITGAGGFLQTVTAGYPGLRLGSDADSGDYLSFTPKCIPGISYMKLKHVTYLNSDLKFEYWCAEIEVSDTSKYNPIPIRVSISSASPALSSLATSTLKIQSIVSTEGEVKTSTSTLGNTDFDSIMNKAQLLKRAVSFKIYAK